jgi:nitroreductase
MQDILDVIKSRRSIRIYRRGEKVPDDLLRKVLEAGLWSPTGSNVQPWEFIVVREEANLKRVKALTPGIFDDPPVIIVLCVNRERAREGGPQGEAMALMDVAMAAQNMMLEAHSLGLASCPVLSFSKEGLKELLEIPENVDPVLMLTLGYPGEHPKPPKRRSLEEVVHYERF